MLHGTISVFRWAHWRAYSIEKTVFLLVRIRTAVNSSDYLLKYRKMAFTVLDAFKFNIFLRNLLIWTWKLILMSNTSRKTLLQNIIDKHLFDTRNGLIKINYYHSKLIVAIKMSARNKKFNCFFFKIVFDQKDLKSNHKDVCEQAL